MEEAWKNTSVGRRLRTVLQRWTSPGRSAAPLENHSHMGKIHGPKIDTHMQYIHSTSPVPLSPHTHTLVEREREKERKLDLGCLV